jgi:hypothetical protein
MCGHHVPLHSSDVHTPVSSDMTRLTLIGPSVSPTPNTHCNFSIGRPLHRTCHSGRWSLSVHTTSPLCGWKTHTHAYIQEARVWVPVQLIVAAVLLNGSHICARIKLDHRGAGSGCRRARACFCRTWGTAMPCTAFNAALSGAERRAGHWRAHGAQRLWFSTRRGA